MLPVWSSVSSMDALRVVVVPTVVIAVIVSPGAAASADPPPTQVITTIAVGSQGQAVNGYQEAPPEGNVAVVNDCSTPSPSAMAANVYACSPSAAGAATCWPSTPGSLLCVDNPWDKLLHRVAYTGQLPPVQHPASPDPFALLLDDGTRCLLRNGGSWGGRDDGYVGAYGCGNPGINPRCCRPRTRAWSGIDRSGSVWTVKVGQLGAPDAHFPPPQTHAVASAWLGGDRIPG